MINQMTRTEIMRFMAKQPKFSKAQRKAYEKANPEEKKKMVQSTSKWDLSQSQIDRDIKTVEKSWNEAIMPEKKKMRMQLWYTYKSIIAKSKLYGDNRTTLIAMQGIREMLGLDIPKETKEQKTSDEVDLKGIAEILKGRFK